MMIFDPFVFFILINIIFFLLGLYQYKIKQYLGFYRPFVKHWNEIENIVLVLMCIISIGFVDSDADFFELTILQMLIILIVCKEYSYDLGKCFLVFDYIPCPRVIYSPCFDTAVIAHHVLGLIGCGYLFLRSCGGRVIIRLLLDILTNLISYLRNKYPHYFFGSMFFQRFCETISWVICVSIRLIYYPLVLVESLLTIWRSMTTTDEKIHHFILLIFFTCWLVFSTIYHILWMRDVFDDDDSRKKTTRSFLSV